LYQIKPKQKNMKKLVLFISIFAICTSVMAQEPPYPYINSKAPAYGGSIIYAPTAACDNEKGYYDFPFTENGITVTGTGTGSFTVYAPGWGSCGIFAAANCVWIGNGGPATFTNTFTEPVNNMIYNITAMDATEIITITTDAGTPSITYSDGTCPEAISITGNVITCISTPGNGAGGRFIVTSTQDFNSITFSINGILAGTTMTMCFDQVFNPPTPSEVPVSNWALILGGLMIATFVFIRFRRMI
jgi:hypothetical protein